MIRHDQATQALRTVRARLRNLASVELLDPLVTEQLGPMIACVDVALMFLAASAPKPRRAKKAARK